MIVFITFKILFGPGRRFQRLCWGAPRFSVSVNRLSPRRTLFTLRF